MISWIVLNDELWNALSFAPIVLGILAGIIIAASCSRSGWTPHCTRCGHDLRAHVAAGACPECGAELRASGAVVTGKRRIRWRLLAIGAAVGTLAALTMPRAPLNLGRCRAAMVRLVQNAELFGERANTQLNLWRNEVTRRAQRGDRDFVAAAVSNFVNGMQRSAGSSFDVLRELDRHSALTADDHRAVIASLVEGLDAGRIPPAQAFAAIGLFGHGASDPYLRGFASRASVASQLVELRIEPNPVTERSTVIIGAVARSTSLGVEINRVAFRPVGTQDWIDVRLEPGNRASGWAQSCQWKRDLPGPGIYEIRCDALVRAAASDDGTLPEITTPITLTGTMTRAASER